METTAGTHSHKDSWLLVFCPFCFLYSPYHHLYIFAEIFFKNNRHPIISSAKYFNMAEFTSDNVETNAWAFFSGYEKARFGEKQK